MNMHFFTTALFSSFRCLTHGRAPVAAKQICLHSLLFLLLMPGCIIAAENDWTTPVPHGEKTRWGFITFPFDLTLEAIDKTHEIARNNGSLYVIHRDNGIPWKEALEDTAFPPQVEQEWNDYLARRPSGVPVYLALAPLAEDRQSLIHASEGSATPASFYSNPLDSEEVKTAYRNYVRRAVEKFHPDFLNLGIEAGQMAARNPQRWASFVELFKFVVADVRNRYPTIKVGISFGLQSLMDPEVEQRAGTVIQLSDYLGLSFYPFLSALPEAFGATPLPAPPEQWRKALRWLEKFNGRIPVAICETAYASTTGSVDGLAWEGSPALQEAYVRDLARAALENNYLFVTWFAPVDYDALSQRLFGGRPGIHLIWQNSGMLDPQLRPKPALQVWRTAVTGHLPAPPPTAAAASSAKARSVRLDAQQAPQLFEALPGNLLQAEQNGGPGGIPALRWSFDYHQGEFQWIVWSFEEGTLADTGTMKVMVRSDRPGPVLIQLEEARGEAYYLPVTAGNDWTAVDAPFSRFQVDVAKRKDGTLEPSSMVKLLVADPGAVTEGAEGQRILWFADWQFQ